MYARLYYGYVSPYRDAAMIKLQLLLRHARPEPVSDPAMHALLDAHGITVTCEGRASLSATVAEEAYTRLFGALEPVASAAARAFEMPTLPVPADLADVISLITIAPGRASLTTSES